LFVLIGTTYGGNGTTNYALPDLRGRVAIHQGTNASTGTNYVIGEQGGEENVTLTNQTIPSHSHVFVVSGSPGTVTGPAGNFLGEAPGGLGFAYGSPPNTAMAEGMVAVSGGSQPHNNIQPYVTLNYIISMFGIFPSQS
jgi:microcystin-dependent protein